MVPNPYNPNVNYARIDLIFYNNIVYYKLI